VVGRPYDIGPVIAERKLDFSCKISAENWEKSPFLCIPGMKLIGGSFAGRSRAWAGALQAYVTGRDRCNFIRELPAG
jgi:hypothetical protein